MRDPKELQNAVLPSVGESLDDCPHAVKDANATAAPPIHDGHLEPQLPPPAKPGTPAVARPERAAPAVMAVPGSVTFDMDADMSSSMSSMAGVDLATKISSYLSFSSYSLVTCYNPSMISAKWRLV